jgi:hypothetical protein
MWSREIGVWFLVILRAMLWLHPNFLFPFETQPHYVAQAVLKLKFLLLQPLSFFLSFFILAPWLKKTISLSHSMERC